MKRPIIYPYNRYSQAVRALADYLGCRRIRRPERYVRYNSHAIINYGVCNPHLSLAGSPLVINPYTKVVEANNKLTTLQRLKQAEVLCPDFTQDLNEARMWSENSIIVARSLLRASGGRGIAVTDKGQPPAESVDGQRTQIWVRYVPKRSEFRVHVFNGQVIDVQQKKKRNEEEADYRIRNHANGWVFARNDIVEPANLRDVSVHAVNALGLTFGAVDVVWNEKQNLCYVLEINTAPGLEGTTVHRYGDAIRNYCNTL